MSQRSKREPFQWLLAGLSWLGSLLGLGCVGYLGDWLALRGIDMVFLIGSFGASAVLLYAAPSVPYSQPRNVLGGQVFSAFVGVTVYQLLPVPLWLGAALAVTIAIGVMQITRTLHPPGGGSALIAVLGDDQVHALGYWYVLSPVAIGTLLMLAVALLVNNLPRSRRYPLTWL